MDPVIHILLVEDDPAHAELIERAFDGSSGRFRVSVAGNLAAAQSLLRQTVPDLIIADWRLPDGDGLDLLKGSDGRAEIPVVLMTSHGNERVAVEAIQSGVLDYVVKSVESLSDMPHTADRALREWIHRRERARMQEALQASERKYRFLADHVVDVIWTMDLQMHLTFMSPSAETMYGWTLEEWATLQPQDYLTPQSLAIAQKTLADHLAMQGRPEDEEVTLEMEQYRKDGTTFWTEVKARLLRGERGTPASIIGSTRDITGRKRVEQALVQEKAFSDMVIDSLPGVFYICDEQGLLLRWNDNEKVVTGYSREDLSQMSVLGLFQHDRELMAAHLREVFETGRASVEASIVTRSGMSVPFYLTGFRMVSDDKRYLVGVGIDISERRRLEQQLIHAQKMEAIGVLAGGVAHDFNNILTAIIGYASLMELKMGRNDPLRNNVEQILTSVERASALTQGLLAFSRKQVVTLEVVNANDLIYAFHKILARLIGEDIDFKLDLTAEKVTVRLGRGQLEQVLMNLVTNARDAMPNGGKLKISTDQVTFDGDQGEITGGSYALIEVSDTGTGIEKDEIGHIFEPFYTTKETGKGTGLGLAIVYGIITKHNGYINVSSEPGQGTTFKIYLPLIPVAAEEETQKGTKVLPVGRSETILLVEDEDSVRRVARVLLEEFGYTVLEAGDGEAGVNVFQENQDRIRLVLCDVIMPKKNGQETYEEIRKMRPDIRMIFMSGYTADIVEQKGLLESGLDIISKPLNPSELLQSIRKTLDRQ
jgi:PAS domain S-box-containing protein